MAASLLTPTYMAVSNPVLIPLGRRATFQAVSKGIRRNKTAFKRKLRLLLAMVWMCGQNFGAFHRHDWLWQRQILFYQKLLAASWPTLYKGERWVIMYDVISLLISEALNDIITWWKSNNRKIKDIAKMSLIGRQWKQTHTLLRQVQ